MNDRPSAFMDIPNREKKGKPKSLHKEKKRRTSLKMRKCSWSEEQEKEAEISSKMKKFFEKSGSCLISKP